VYSVKQVKGIASEVGRSPLFSGKVSKLQKPNQTFSLGTLQNPETNHTNSDSLTMK